MMFPEKVNKPNTDSKEINWVIDKSKWDCNSCEWRFVGNIPFRMTQKIREYLKENGQVGNCSNYNAIFGEYYIGASFSPKKGNNSINLVIMPSKNIYN